LDWLRRLAGVIDVGFKDYDDYEKVVYRRDLLDLPNDPLVAIAAGAGG
jgi:hypothetical protein